LPGFSILVPGFRSSLFDSKMAQKLRFALIGCGVIGRLRAAALAESASCSLAVVSDVDEARGREVAAKHGAGYEKDWRAALDGRVDAVIVSTPPPLHVENCVASFERGKHVLCEKPLARTPAECRQILEASQKSGRHLATGFNYRFYPAIQAIHGIFTAGGIGELDHIRAYTGHPGGKEFSHPWVHDVSVVGGGAMMDNGIHILDLTLYFLGQPTEVKGFRTHRIWNFEGCEDNAFALVRNTRGNIAQVQASWSEWRGYRWWIEVYGTRGMLRASYPPMLASATTLDDGGAKHTRRFLFPTFQVEERLRGPYWTVQQSFVPEFECFARAARGEATSAATGVDGARAVEVAHAVYLGSDSGGSVAVG
jgi:predicted dehydrogenase